MYPWVRILKVSFAKKGLIIPILFLLTEIVVAIILNWQLFGEKYQFSTRGERSEMVVHNPLIVISTVHSDRLTHPYGSLTPEVPFMKFYSNQMVLKTLYFLTSLVFAYLGIVVSVLWVNNYFKNFKNRNVNVQWWLWPTACFGAHILLFFLANSNFSLFIGQY